MRHLGILLGRVSLRLISTPDCVVHYTEGRSAWKSGVLGFLSRLSGIGLTLGVTIALMTSAPWWWPSSIPDTIAINTTAAFVAVALVTGLLSTGGFLYLRRRVKRSLEIKGQLHELAHYLRDHETRMFKKAELKNIDREEVVLASFCEHMDRICEYTREYFKSLTRDSTISCAIRVAVEVDGDDGGQRYVYKTLGRSHGLSQDRQYTTEDIPANRGIPRFLHDHDCKGILQYNDIEAAAKIGAFQLTGNEEKYPDEIVTMMVGPTNGWDGKRQSMLGLLYVTSRSERVFSRKHVDCVRFLADTIAESLAFTVQSLKNGGAIRTIRRCQ